MDPELAARLSELHAEFEEGDITEKGYLKRRSMLFAQYGAYDPATASMNIPHNASPRSSLSVARTRDSLVRSGTPGSSTAVESQYSGGRRGSAADDGYYGRSTLPLHVRNASGASEYLQPNSRNASMSSLQVPGHIQQQQLNPPAPLYVPFKGQQSQPFQEEFIPPDMSYEQQRHASIDNSVYDIPGQYFSDFTETPTAMDPYPQPQHPGLQQRYSSGDAAFSPAAIAAPPMLSAADLPQGIVHQMPLEQRDIPFDIHDPHNDNIPMAKFDNIAAILRHRARTIAKHQAYLVLDSKGRECATCTWEKLASRAEKVAQVIRDKSNLYRGDRVALIYRDIEIIDFSVALLGCFIAGVVAVPINYADDYSKLNYILTQTQAHLALTTEHNLKAFQRDISANKLSWPKNVEWWKTNEFGSYQPRRKDEPAPALQISDLAYIEFSRAPTGDLKGVVMSHRTIMHQMACISAIIASADRKEDSDTFPTGLKDKMGKVVNRGSTTGGEVLVSYLDPRQQIGLIIGVLLGVYGGQTTVWCSSQTLQTPGQYANILSRYKATLCLADYPGLKFNVYNYQQDPDSTLKFVSSKRDKRPNLASMKLMLIDALTVDAEFHEILADRWLRPLGNTKAYREVVAPMLCLAEHGGMVICMRDWLGGEERMGIGANPPPTAASGDVRDDGSSGKSKKKPYGNLVSYADEKNNSAGAEVLLDKEALKTNDVVVVAAGDEARKRAGEEGTIRVGSFGYPIPDATLAIVDPETSVLCAPNVIGEIWVDSPSLSGGFWALAKEAETIFHARAYMFEEGNPHPVAIEPEFLRTGLLGFVLEGRVFVLGLYEDRLRQKVEWVEDAQQDTAEYRYFFVQHLIVTIMRKINKVYDCSAFDVFVNDEHLPIVVLESPAASTAPQNPGGPPRQLNTALLESLSEKCMEILFEHHHLRVYCVMITAPNTLPRIVKNGRREIGNMLCRREFDKGSLPCVHVKFGVERAVLNLPVGIDPVGGIWSTLASQSRTDVLLSQEQQVSGIDYREVVIDDRTSTPLNHFSSIVDLLQWRVARQAEELSYVTIDVKGKEGKSVSWRKLDTKIAAVAAQMRNKWKIKAGDHVILMYTHSEEFVYAVHACFCLGVVAMPIAPLDQNRLNEDVPALLHMIQDYNVKTILVNQDVDHLIKLKPIISHIKQSASVMKIILPPIHSTAKPPKQNSGCRDLGFTMRPEWVRPEFAALVWIYWTPDQRRVAVAMDHGSIMGACKVQKETCQMTSSRPVLGCVRSYSGIGFLHTCLLGIYVGASTYLHTPVDYAANPFTLYLALSRYKVKDAYATTQMLEHAMNSIPGKGFTLHELRNLMIACDQRPRVDISSRVKAHFAPTGLDRTAVNTVYSHVLNPTISTRSYMNSEPIDLYLDTKALRRGFIYPVHPDSGPPSSMLLVQDSGMVAVNTSIAIVNPETCAVCRAGELGEIWIESEATAKSFYGSRDKFDLARFQAKTVDGASEATYVRTGDLGFLHSVSRPMGVGGAMLNCNFLFVLGSIGETFEVNGLNHFPVDIEASVERCHRNICPGGSAVFQAGGLVVLLVEVHRKSYLASLVPVILNAVLNEHQLVVDIIAFVGRGDFPRSRLNEKQRGKILASWVTKKLRTIAQFGIRDGSNPATLAQGNAVVGGGTMTMTMNSGMPRIDSLHSGSMTRRSTQSPSISLSLAASHDRTISELPAIPAQPQHQMPVSASGPLSNQKTRYQASTSFELPTDFNTTPPLPSATGGLQPGPSQPSGLSVVNPSPRASSAPAPESQPPIPPQKSHRRRYSGRDSREIAGEYRRELADLARARLDEEEVYDGNVLGNGRGGYAL